MEPPKNSKTASFIQGRFSAEDARELLTRIYRVKISFHEEKMLRHPDCADVLQFSMHRIAILKESLRRALQEVSESDGWVDLFSSIWVARVQTEGAE